MNTPTPEIQKNVIEILRKIKAVQYGNFILKDGTKSTIYIDLRILPNYPVEFKKIIEITYDFFSYCGLISEFEGIITPPLAGIPLGVALALKLEKKFYLARLTPKKHGTKKLIEGEVSNKQILIIDDVITSGGSKLSILNAVRDQGGLVNSLFVFVNRMNSIELLKEFEIQNKVNLLYLVSIEDIMRVYQGDDTLRI